MPIKKDHDEPEGWWSPNGGWTSQHNRVVMEDLPEAKRITLEKELKEETVVARRRKLACFQKRHTEVIKKTTPTIMTTATTAEASTVTPNMTPE
jgi:hypothetical protein